MKRSTDRIVTTHAGSLARPPAIVALLGKRDRGEPHDAQALQTQVKSAVADVVRKQIDLGIDSISDGEQGKEGFISYVLNRLGGIERRVGARPLNRTPAWTPASGIERQAQGAPLGSAPPGAPGHMRLDVSEFHAYAIEQAEGSTAGIACVGPLTVKDASAVRTDIINVKAALGKANVEVFMPAASPGQVVSTMQNDFYKSEEELLFAAAEAMRDEYEAIAEAGFVLQLDCPELAAAAARNLAGLGTAAFRKVMESHVEAVNHAVRNIDREKIRVHVCWGNYEGPHHRDMPLRDVVDIVLRIKAAAFTVEAANPRHQHEWAVWRDIRLPPDTVLVPGVVDNKTNIVEHPDVVAERIVRYAQVVGRERIIAGVDCGFSTNATGRPRCHPEIAWAKLYALAEGARRASKQLWS